jgi:hypothetical protein
MTDVLGVLVIARNGGRYEYYQDPKTYEPAFTESTPLGAVSIPPSIRSTGPHMFAPTLAVRVSPARVFPSLGLPD